MKAGLVFTDPSYNVKVADIVGSGKTKHKEIAAYFEVPVIISTSIQSIFKNKCTQPIPAEIKNYEKYMPYATKFLLIDYQLSNEYGIVDKSVDPRSEDILYYQEELIEAHTVKMNFYPYYHFKNKLFRFEVVKA